MIAQELMRELLKDDLEDLSEIVEFVPNEIVYKALIIREFMKERGIEDSRTGIREFYGYERERLKRLGLLGGSDQVVVAKKALAAGTMST